ncbi:hypothetical protein KQI63_13350 [bacterium]|nr:hypothetical protein [bacterium]
MKNIPPHSLRMLPLWIVLILGAYAAPLQATMHGREVIHRQDILDAGITRLGDVVLLADSWSTSTMDGFTHFASPGVLQPFEGQDYTVLIDGVPVDLQLFDSQMLNRLPISINEIDSVEFFNQPGLHEGIFTDRGLIHIHTQQPEAGYSLGASVRRGYVTRDNGTLSGVGDLATDDPDRVGPDVSLNGAVRHGETWVAYSLKREEQPLDGPKMRPRLRTFQPNGDAKLGLLGGSTRFGWTMFGGSHRALVGSSSIDPGFLFLPPYGREIPTQMTLDAATMSGSIPTKWALVDYRLGAVINTLDYQDNPYSIGFDYQRQDYRGSIEASRWLGPAHLLVGFQQHGGYELSDSHKSGDETFGQSHLYGSIIYDQTPILRHTLAADLDARIDMRGVKASYRGELLLSDTRRLSFTTSYTERLFDADPATWVTYGFDGYNFAPDTLVTFQGTGYYDVESVRQYSSFLDFEQRIGSSTRLTLGAFYRFVPATVIPSYSYSFVNADSALHVNREAWIVSYQSGNLFGGSVQLSNRLGKTIRQSLSYRWLNHRDGTWLFAQTWKALPEHQAAWRVTWAPGHGTRLHTDLTWRSETEWAAFQSAADSSNGFFKAGTDPILNLNVTVSQLMWKDRIRASLAVRNLLDQPRLTHPAASDEEGLTILLGFGIRLD